MKLNSTALEALRDIALAAGDDGRPLLAQLRIAAVEGGLDLDATDSYVWVHRHIAADMEEETVGTAILVPALTIRGIALACLRDSGTTTMGMAAEGLTFDWTNLGLTDSRVSVEAYKTSTVYPTERWRDLPTEAVESVILAPELVDRAARALGAELDREPRTGVLLEFHKPLSAVRMTLAGATTDYAWVMPQRPPGNS